MKTFTAKQLSRAPAKIFDAAREDGKVEITHDRFTGRFQLYHVPDNLCEIEAGFILEVQGMKPRVIPYKIGNKHKIGFNKKPPKGLI